MRGRGRSIAVSRGRALSASSGVADPIGDALRADVVAYYKLDNVNDSGPGGYTLTNNNSVGFSAGKVGNAADFVAASNQSLSRSGSDLDITTTDFGFAFWLNTSVTGDSFASKGSIFYGSGGWYIYGLNSTQIRFELNIFGGSIVDLEATVGTYADGNWHLLVVNGDRSGNLEMFLDNDSKGVVDISAFTGTAAFSGDFLLGDYYYSGTEYDGSLDEFIFRRSLWTADERDYLWNSGAGRSLY